MKSLKPLFILICGVTLFAAACAKHAIPNYYDSEGHKIPYSEYKGVMECKSHVSFDVDNENQRTLKKYGTHKSYVIRTYLVSDSQAEANSKAAIEKGAAAPQQEISEEAKQKIAAIKAEDDFLVNYPLDRTVVDNQTDRIGANNQKLIDNILMTKTCETNMAKYSGPGVTGHVSGPITTITPNSIEINGTQDVFPNQTIDLTVERMIPDGTVKLQKGPAVIAKYLDSIGQTSLKVTLVKKSAMGSRTIIFRQDVVDDATTVVTVSRDILQEYSQGLQDFAAAAEIDSKIQAAIKTVKPDKTVDIEVGVLEAARDAILAKRAVTPAHQQTQGPIPPAPEQLFELTTPQPGAPIKPLIFEHANPPTPPAEHQQAAAAAKPAGSTNADMAQSNRQQDAQLKAANAKTEGEKVAAAAKTNAAAPAAQPASATPPKAQAAAAPPKGQTAVAQTPAATKVIAKVTPISAPERPRSTNAQMAAANREQQMPRPHVAAAVVPPVKTAVSVPAKTPASSVPTTAPAAKTVPASAKTPSTSSAPVAVKTAASSAKPAASSAPAAAPAAKSASTAQPAKAKGTDSQFGGYVFTGI